MSSTAIPNIVPAQLSFLALYNPSLGSSDDTFHQQIVFYYGRAAKGRSKPSNGSSQTEQALRDRENEKLRQVGLAQGMVGFAKSFSNGEAIDSVETQKSRIVLHELEEDWWILASIDLTRLPASKRDSGNNATEPTVEYSSREVSPPGLLIQQLVRAQSIFLLHHGASLAVMFAKYGRQKFCSILDKYWSRFSSTWDVLLHASPAVDIYNGMKLAAGGELGVGVGEEEWGSGERDVLENFASKTDGLMDIIVSRFGNTSPLQEAKTSTDPKNLDFTESEPWMGSGRHVHAADGVVFSGLGVSSPKSLRDVSHWVESIYSHGQYAYGVRDNPASDRKKRRRRNTRPGLETEHHSSSKGATTVRNDGPSPVIPRIPPPIVKKVEFALDKATSAVDSVKDGEEPPKTPGSKPMLASLGDTEMWMKYMTLGYGTTWGGKKSDEPAAQESAPRRTPSPEPMRHIDPTPDIDVAEERRKAQIQQENDGYFLIGLKGDMEDLSYDDNNEEGNWNNRIPLRTIYIEIDRDEDVTPMPSSREETPLFEREMMNFQKPPKSNFSRVRPVVYVHRPFIYTFLFNTRTDALSISSFYRDIHHFFSPLHRSLDKSTSPDKVEARLAASAALNPHTTTPSTKNLDSNTQPIYDLVFDPISLTVQSSLPNIPDPGVLIAEGLSSTASNGQSWSRAEALNVHSQILSTVSSTRRNLTEIERTCKTSRGWWVVWMRLPPSRFDRDEAMQSQRQIGSQSQPRSQPQTPPPSSHDASTSTSTSTSTTPRPILTHTSSALFNTDELREAFLIRRARDAASSASGPGHKSSGSRFSNAMCSTMGLGSGVQSQRMGGAAAGWEPKALAEGIGVDARRYIEDLLSVGR